MPEGKAACSDKAIKNNQYSCAMLKENPQHFLEVSDSFFSVSKRGKLLEIRLLLV